MPRGSAGTVLFATIAVGLAIFSWVQAASANPLVVST
jgi:hypothetical protein